MDEKVLILSDGKPGHLNQSIAFCELKNISYDIVTLDTSKKIKKIFSYLLDKLSLSFNLFNLQLKNKDYTAIVSTGSFTYYSNIYLAKKFGIKNIAIMLPKGFNYRSFDYILAQDHDYPPRLSNIISIPLNLSINRPQGLLEKKEKSAVGIILGGNNSIFTMKKEEVKKALDEIYRKFPNHLKYITTSRRTPDEVDVLLEQYSFDYEVIFSKNKKVNPLPDFLDVCNELYISIDSTSMLSEAKANSDANIHIINLTSSKMNTKYHRLASKIEKMKDKFDYGIYLEKVKI